MLINNHTVTQIQAEYGVPQYQIGLKRLNPIDPFGFVTAKSVFNYMVNEGFIPLNTPTIWKVFVKGELMINTVFCATPKTTPPPSNDHHQNYE